MLLSMREIKRRARRIKLLLMDCDGVLTDGRIYYLPYGRSGFMETKTFFARDGLGIRYAHLAGIKTGIISGRGTPVVRHRVKELGIHFLYEGALDKLGPFNEIMRKAGIQEQEVCYMGDDVVDLPILERCGLAVGVGDSHPALKRQVHYMTRANGGRGAVRETIDLILAAQGRLNAARQSYAS